MWLHVPLKYLAYAAESECSNNPQSPPFTTTASPPTLSVTVNGKPSPRPCSLAYKMRPITRLLYGTISQPSTAARGVESWIASLRDCPAPPTPVPESDSETTTTAHGDPMANPAHNSTSSESSQTSCPESSSWRTFLDSYQADIFDDSERGYWDWVTESRLRSTSLQTQLARHKNANASTLWPTAKTPTGGANSNRDNRPQTGGADLQESIQNWASARAEDSERTRAHRGNPDTLQSQSSLWAAPSAATGGKICRGNDRTDELLIAGQVKAWATPRAIDAHGADYQNQRDGTRIMCLPGQAKEWSTPRARDWKQKGFVDCLPTEAMLWASSRPDAATTPIPHGNTSSTWTPPSSPRLSPVFQWWLMGWPFPHRIYSASAATEWSRWLRQLHSSIYSIQSTLNTPETTP